MGANGKPQDRRRRGRAKPAEARERFLTAFREEVTITAAAAKVGVGRSTLYEWRKTDPDFREAWDQVEEEITERLEREAYRRAVEGVDKPIFQAGKHVGDVRQYSDRLLEVLLRARKPEAYRDRVSIADDREAERRREVDRMDEAELDRELAGIPDNNVVPIRRAAGS